MKIYSTLLLHNYHDYTCTPTPNLYYVESLKQNTAQDAWTNQRVNSIFPALQVLPRLHEKY